MIFVAKNGSLQGIIAAKDAVRPGAGKVLERAEGRRRRPACYLVTGDCGTCCKGDPEDLGFDAYAASLMPEEKADYVERLRAAGKTVVMVGDGVNDALALSKADVSVAMGAGGAEAAIETADISLADSDLGRLVSLRHLSHGTLRVIEQNHWLAVSTNVLGIAAGAAGLITPADGRAAARRAHRRDHGSIRAASSQRVWMVPNKRFSLPCVYSTAGRRAPYTPYVRFLRDPHCVRGNQ